MQVILLEKIRNLGDFGQMVTVANGYARNWLIPEGMAVLATELNKLQFEARRAELEKASMTRVHAAEARAEKLQGLTLVIPANAADEGKLYG
ncbi:MAG: 50S ribosomal protein L9, partial [Pseudomonadota bacterium]